jgi:hypothetical protein
MPERTDKRDREVGKEGVTKSNIRVTTVTRRLKDPKKVLATLRMPDKTEAITLLEGTKKVKKSSCHTKED